MAHHTLKNGHDRFTDRLNRFPQGAPPSTYLRRILELLMDEREAELLSLVPIRPFTAERAARAWKTSVADARTVLDELASRALLVDVVRDDGTTYVLPPPMAGFFEFSLMRVRDDLDQRQLSELFHEYLNVEEDFVRALFADGTTQLGRVFVQEPMLPRDDTLEVLDHERATEVIETATHIGVGLCYCRHKMQHLDRACDAPLDICMTFNSAAESLCRHGHARTIDAHECKDLLERAYDHGLVQFGENVQQRVSFICNCCGCCCEAMIAARRFAEMRPIHTTNYLPEVDCSACNGCSRCVDACPVEALTLVSANDPAAPRRRAARVADDACLGCGVCVRSCTRDAISLRPRAARVITPVNSAHRYVLMAIERGKLQNLVFDDQVLTSHRAMAAVLGAILRLPPVKRALASEQVRSRYLARLCEKVDSG